MHRRTLLKSAAASIVAYPTLCAAKAASAAFLYKKHYADVLGSRMAYVDEGQGDPVVFLHGNPTSSYLWRNIIPAADGYRAIAPDLIGMGDSDQPNIGYTYADHSAYLFALLEQLDLTDVTLVVHDWGSALGLDWAQANPDRVRAVAFMEAILPPALPFPSYEAMGPFEDLFRSLRAEGPGEAMVLGQNFFIEEILGKMAVATPLSEEVLTHYRAPYPTEASRKPLLVWPRQIPIAGTPADVEVTVRRYSAWLIETDIPKLMFHASPGALIPPEAAAWLQRNLTNLTSVDLGTGVHFLQEDHPDAIRHTLAEWLKTEVQA
ncbi:MAG: haloalkane dehalogenase [Pseudomonadota bacterium]